MAHAAITQNRDHDNYWIASKRRQEESFFTSQILTVSVNYQYLWLPLLGLAK